MKRSKFSLSHYKLATMDMGLLIPISWYEALPGDSIQHSTSALIRVSPLLSPVMHPVRVRIHHWFVPNRLIWTSWEDFITGGKDGKDATAVPVLNFSACIPGTLADYLGVPCGTYTNPLPVSALPFRAYNLIYNEHYRDQDLIPEKVVNLGNGVDAITPRDLIRCAWEKDYFTTARPWEQKGNEVTIPLGESAPVKSTDMNGIKFKIGGSPTDFSLSTTGTDPALWVPTPGGLGGNYAHLGQDGSSGVYADLSEATGINISDLRLATAIQRYQEARAMYGSRYTEYLRYLGVRSSDARLQNPEYLGGGRQVIQFSEILKTGAGEDPAEPIGTMKGHGIAAMRSNRFRRFFEEHGIVMTLISVVPKSIYSQALHKKWSRTIKEEYYQRELQFIGDQIIKNKEVYAEHTLPEDTFGYSSRYDEYKSIQSSVSGEFVDILNYWHYAREFSGDIALNQSFIDAVPTKRVNASTTTNCLYGMFNHKIQARRMLVANPQSKLF